MKTSKRNLAENKNIFLHVFKEDAKDPEQSIQYKITCNAEVETSGELFEEIKKTEKLPEGYEVNGIIIASICSCEESVG